jgi:hypothetical protein
MAEQVKASKKPKSRREQADYLFRKLRTSERYINYEDEELRELAEDTIEEWSERGDFLPEDEIARLVD